MSGLLEAVAATLDPRTLEAMARKLGTTPQQTEHAVAAALPLLVGQMARNAEQPSGADALQRALQRDHAGVDLGGVLGGLLGGGGDSGGIGGLLGGVLGSRGGTAPAPRRGDMMSEGAAILGHVFGQRQQRVANGVGQVSGLGNQQSSQLMAMLAPIVMTVLARMMQGKSEGSADLGGMLGAERQQAQQGAGGGLMNALLDRDGDGDVDVSDLIQSGSMLGGLFGKR